MAADFALSADTTLTIAAGDTTSTGTVTIEANNNGVDAPDKTVTVSASAANSQGVTAPADLTLTLEDDEEAPTATLILTPDSINEKNGSSTVTASLSHASSETTTITVSAAAVEPAVAADFALSDNTILTIAAGATSSTGTVTIGAVNNGVDAPDKTVTVSASATNTQGVNAPANLTLTLEDDEEAPTATLILTPDSIGENGKSSTVTATLNHASSAETTLSVSATAGANTVAADFALSADTTLTIAVGATSSTGTVTITAVNNTSDDPNKQVTVSASASNSQGVTAPADKTLTIEDDEGEPTVTLILTPDSISENGGSSTVTAELSHTSSAKTTITVSAAALLPTVAADFALSANKILTIAAGATSSTETVTIEAVNNGVDAPDKTVTVSAGALNSQGVNAPATKTLTITDDEEAPTVTLILTPDSIDENSGESTVTATLNHTSSEETTVTVMAAAVEPAEAADFTLSANKILTIAAGATSSTGTVTIDAVNNGVDAPDKQVTVSASASNSQGVTAPADKTLTLEDDEEAPTATLVLTPDSIGENGGSSTVSATLNHPSSEETTIMVSAAAGDNTVDGDFTLSDNTTLTIAAGATSSTGTVTIAAVNNTSDDPNKEVTVSASAANTQGVIAPADKTLTLEDDEGEPTVTLILTPDSIGEDGGSSTVTAELSHVSNAETTITVLVEAVSPAVATDFTLSANKILTIAAGATSSTETVTIEAVNNGVDAPDKQVTVSASASNSQGVIAPEDVTLTLTDDEAAPTATLILTPDSIGEDGGSSTVTAELSHASSETTTITVSADAVSPAVAADFDLSDNTTLTIAADATTSTGTVTIDANNNSVDAPDKTVTVSASASNSQGVTAPADKTLTIEDDEGEPTARLILTPDSINEKDGSSTVTAELSHASSAETTLTVSATAGADTVAGDFALSATTILTIAAGTTSSTGMVTIEAVDNTSDDPDKQVTVSASASNSQGVIEPADLTLTIVDDENPTVTLILTPDSIGENGGSSTVTATLNNPLSAETTITVSAAAVSPAVAADLALSANTTLSIAADATSSTGTVTIAAVNNSVDAPDKQVTVTASAINSVGAVNPSSVSLTIIDDDGAPAMTLVRTPASISENGGMSMVTATLDHPSSALTTITVLAAPGADTLPEDFELSTNIILTIAAGAMHTSETVTVTAVDNDADEPDKTVALTCIASNDQGIADHPDNVELYVTIIDDEGGLLPQETLAVKALLTRIGRIAASHVVDEVGSRMLGANSGSHVTLAGQRLPFGDATLPQANAFIGQGVPGDARPLNHEWNQISGEREDLQGTSVRSITPRDILTGSSFSLRLAEDDDERTNTEMWTAWGLTAQSGFDGREDDDLLLNGDVTTVMMGLDAEWNQTMAGVAVAHSSGDGAFEVNGSCDDPRCKGTLKTRLTGVYPYLRHDVNERLSISGVLGYAKGDLAYSGDSVAGIESGTAAFSARGTLQPAPSQSGFEFAARLDAFVNWVRAEETARREAIEANTSRLRLALEASHTLALGSDRTLTSTLQLGHRHDGGDAEIGHGWDIKAALRYADPAHGLSAEGTIHKLIAHEDADYEEQGVSASVRLHPDAAGLGLSLSLASSWNTGATRTNPSSIWNTEYSPENSNFNSAMRLDAELGYGLEAFGGSVHTPYFGFSLSDSGETIQRLGWRLRTGSFFTLKLETARHRQSDGETTQNSFDLQISAPW